jgi:hypothetical protein
MNHTETQKCLISLLIESDVLFRIAICKFTTEINQSTESKCPITVHSNWFDLSAFFQPYHEYQTNWWARAQAVTRQVPHVEQELHTLPEHLIFPLFIFGSPCDSCQIHIAILNSTSDSINKLIKLKSKDSKHLIQITRLSWTTMDILILAFLSYKFTCT